MDIGERILILIKELKLTGQKFAESINVNSSNITHIVNNRNKPSYQIISGIMNAYPNVSPDWLINGNGDMFRSSSDYVATFSNTVIDADSIFTQNTTNSDGVFVHSTGNAETEATHSIGEAKEELETKSVSVSESMLVTEDISIEDHAQEQPAQHQLSKEIKRIIIFYNDNSFEEFHN